MASYGSQDCIESAVDSLEHGPFEYLLITGTGDSATRIDSDLCAGTRKTLLKWIRSGELERMLVDHFEENPR